MLLENYYTVQEAVELLPISEEYFRKLVSAIPGAEKKGSTWLIPKKWVEERVVPKGYIPVQDYANAEKISVQGAMKRIAAGKVKAFKPFGHWYVNREV